MFEYPQDDVHKDGRSEIYLTSRSVNSQFDGRSNLKRPQNNLVFAFLVNHFSQS